MVHHEVPHILGITRHLAYHLQTTASYVALAASVPEEVALAAFVPIALRKPLEVGGIASRPEGISDLEWRGYLATVHQVGTAAAASPTAEDEGEETKEAALAASVPEVTIFGETGVLNGEIGPHPATMEIFGKVGIVQSQRGPTPQGIALEEFEYGDAEHEEEEWMHEDDTPTPGAPKHMCIRWCTMHTHPMVHHMYMMVHQTHPKVHHTGAPNGGTYLRTIWCTLPAHN